jgi:hypothetical protein
MPTDFNELRLIFRNSYISCFCSRLFLQAPVGTFALYYFNLVFDYHNPFPTCLQSSVKNCFEMCSFTFLVVVACALTAEVFAIPKGSHHNAAGATGACAVAAGAGTVAASSSGATAVASTTSPISLATSVAAASEAVTRGSTTEVLFEIHGVQNNECLTFRNNGTYPISFLPSFPTPYHTFSC